MKKIISAVLALCLVGGTMPFIENYSHDSSFTVYAEDYTEVTEGDLTYAVYSDHADLLYCKYLEKADIVIPPQINGVPVTKINNESFQRLGEITVEIPDTVTTIGAYAFKSSGLKRLNIPSSVTSIGIEAFAGCYNLTQLIIPDSVIRIDGGAFSSCSNLTEVVLPKNINKIDSWTFYSSNKIKTITIPDSVTQIGIQAFAYCKSLSEITLSENVNLIKENAFQYCDNIKTIVIKNPNCEFESDFILDPDKDRITIKGYRNSTAYKFTERYGYKFEELEESIPITTKQSTIATATSSKTIVTTWQTSLTTVARPTTGKPTTTATTQPVTTHPLGDVNGDDIVDGRDATAILTYYAKTSTGYTGTLEDFIKSQPE